MHAVVVREYIFHNQNKGDKANQNITRTPERAVQAPIESIRPNAPTLPIDMTNFVKEEDE